MIRAAVVDASVAVKWLLPEIDSDAALELASAQLHASLGRKAPSRIAR